MINTKGVISYWFLNNWQVYFSYFSFKERKSTFCTNKKRRTDDGKH